MPTSDEDTEAGSTVPEPANESDFKALQSQMASLMDMMQQQTVATSERFDTLAAENVLLRDEVSHNASLNASPSPTVTPSKPRFGKATSYKVISPRGATTARRSSAYFNAPIDSRVPKLLSNGDGFKDMVKFSGKPHESIQEHFITFEYHARRQEPCYWCGFLQLTMGKTVQQAMIAQGLTLKAGRDSTKTCPAGWYDYDELRLWLTDKYHRDQFQMELLARLFYSYDQTGTLDAYITLVDTKIASCSIVFPDILKKMLVLQKMDKATSNVMSTRPETYQQSYSEFCKRAILEYDTLSRSRPKVDKKKVQYKAKAHSASQIASLDNSDIHTIQSGKKSFDSPWKPGNTRYDNCTPPCNYCHASDHDMKHCGVLRLKYYAEHLDVMPHPPWMLKWLESHDVEEIAALSVCSDEEICAYDCKNDTDWHGLYLLDGIATEAGDEDDSVFYECTDEEIVSTHPLAAVTRSKALSIVVPKASPVQQCDEQPTSLKTTPPPPCSAIQVVVLKNKFTKLQILLFWVMIAMVGCL